MQSDLKALRRRNLLQWWPWFGGTCLGTVLGLAFWLWWQHPLLINPFYVAEQLKAQALAVPTLELMAMFLPIMTLTCLALMLVMLLFAWASFRRERMLWQQLLQRIETSASPDPDARG